MKPIFSSTSALLLLAFVNVVRASEPWEPIRLHPENPHYFLWRDKPTILIGSSEHYGAVLNLPFDYVKYLDNLQEAGLNHTRTFMGLYVEDNGHIAEGPQAGNTLDPAPGQLLCAFARSDVPGYGKGGNKFDLKRWDETFFSRLKDFVTQAAQRGVVVEVNLFCPYYDEHQWKLGPLNPINNVGALGPSKRTDVFTLDRHSGLLPVQEAMVRRIVSELRDADNIYYEICNEPYADGNITREWQHHIADVIVQVEKGFSHKHLISQNIANQKATVEKPDSAVSIFNFHYAWPAETVAMNYSLNRPIGDNETGFRGTADAPYRREAWELILAGGALFSHLDYSFTVGHEDGRFVNPPGQWGGGSPSLREQLRYLKDFIEGFDFLRMKPCQNEIALAQATADQEKTRILIQWNEQAWESLNLPIKPEGTRGDSWLGDGVVLARKIPEGKQAGATAERERIDPAIAEADVKNLIGRWDVVVNQSFKTVWTFHEDGTVESTAGGVRSAHWKPAEKRTTRHSVRALAEPGRQYAIYVSGGTGPVVLEIDLPPGNYRAQWLNPRTGHAEPPWEFSHAGDNRRFESPISDEDVALSIRHGTPPQLPK